MELALTYLDENLNPEGTRAVTEDYRIIDDIIHDTGMWAELTVNPPFSFMKLEVWTHTRDKHEPVIRDPYHFICEVEFPIDIDEQYIAHRWVYHRIQDDYEELAKILAVAELHFGQEGQGLSVTPIGQGYIGWINFEKTSLHIGTPVTREHTVSDVLQIAENLEHYFKAVYSQAKEVTSRISPVTK